jgi:predicted LPLAT superfamily acyltransferase
MGFNALRAMGYDLAVIKGGLPREFKRRRFRYVDVIKETIFVGDPSLAQQYKERILKTLRSGKMIAHYGDAKEGRLKEKVPFLGREMAFPTGMIHLAHQSNAAVIPFIHLYRRGKITLIFKEPIDRGWENGQEEYRRIVSEFAKTLETYILGYPEQYMGIYGPTVLSEYFRLHGEAQAGRE